MRRDGGLVVKGMDIGFGQACGMEERSTTDYHGTTLMDINQTIWMWMQLQYLGLRIEGDRDRDRLHQHVRGARL